MVTPLSVKLALALPFASALMPGMSPAWWSASCGPCGLPDGLKWPPVLMPSPLEQSPFSCAWKPCSLFGGRPVSLASTFTLSPCCWKLTVPAAVLPFVGSSVATALGPPMPILPIMLSIVLQPPSSAAETAVRTAREVRVFMRFSWCVVGALRLRPMLGPKPWQEARDSTRDVRRSDLRGRSAAPVSPSGERLRFEVARACHPLGKLVAQAPAFLHRARPGLDAAGGVVAVVLEVAAI